MHDTGTAEATRKAINQPSLSTQSSLTPAPSTVLLDLYRPRQRRYTIHISRLGFHPFSNLTLQALALAVVRHLVLNVDARLFARWLP